MAAMESHGRPWTCPACAFGAREADGLADHVSIAHLITDGMNAGNGAWRCPVPKCAPRAPLQTAKEFLAHLDQHLFGRLKIEPPSWRSTPHAPARKQKPTIAPKDLLEELLAEEQEEGEPT